MTVISRMLSLNGVGLKMALRSRQQCRSDIGEELARQGIEYVLTTGPLAAEIARGAREGGMTADHAMEAVDHEALAGRLRQLLQPGDIVLVKGSRGARMERVVEAL